MRWQSDNQVSVMMNNGTGGFLKETNLTGVNAAWDVSAADVNGDGHMDIGASGGQCPTSTTYGARLLLPTRSHGFIFLVDILESVIIVSISRHYDILGSRSTQSMKMSCVA